MHSTLPEWRTSVMSFDAPFRGWNSKRIHALKKYPPHPFEQKCSRDSLTVSTAPTSRSAPNLPTRPASPPAAAPRWIPYTLGRITFDLNDLTRVSWPRAPHVPRPTAPLPLRVCNCNVCKDHLTMFTSVVLKEIAHLRKLWWNKKSLHGFWSHSIQRRKLGQIILIYLFSIK